MILAGFVEGNRTALGLFEEEDGDTRLVREEEFKSRAFDSLEQILVSFLERQSGVSLRASCIGVAGPVIDGRCVATNIPWTLEESALAQSVGAPIVKLINDVQATAYGVIQLGEDDFSVVNTGVVREGNRIVVAADTGFGAAILHWDGIRFAAMPTEAGHVSFAPQNDLEMDLLSHLRAKYDRHVSVERVLSRQGLADVYRFLCAREQVREAGEFGQAGEPEHAEELVLRLGLSGANAQCAAALELFASVLGSTAGNLALTCLSFGGVDLSGEIVQRIFPILERGGFTAAFLGKGRFRELLRRMRVRVALNPGTPLLGAASFAARL